MTEIEDSKERIETIERNFESTENQLLCTVEEEVDNSGNLAQIKKLVLKSPDGDQEVDIFELTGIPKDHSIYISIQISMLIRI